MPVVTLNTLDDPRLDLFCRLTDHQLRNRLDPARGVVIAESEKAIRVAIRCGVEPISLLIAEKWLDGMADLIAGLPEDVPVFVLPPEQISRLTGFNVTRGALCALRRPLPRPVSEVLASARRIAVLEGIVDTTNVGAIVRSAAALGLDGVLLTPTCADPLSRRAVRVSMGTIFQIPWGRIGRVASDWPAEGIAELRSAGFVTAALALDDDSLPLNSPELRGIDRLAMVFGTEGDGLAAETVAACDHTVRIPMHHGVDSLNVAAASAVAFWELCR